MPMKRWPIELWPVRLPPRVQQLPVKLWLKQARALLMRLRVPLPLWLRRFGWRRITAVLLLAGIVHICATLAAPMLSSRHAYLLLRDKLPANRMVVLPPQSPGNQLLPYLSPHMLYAVCRYDLSKGPVTVTATVADAGWALSLHAAQGDNFYVLPGQPLRRTEVSLVVIPSGPDAALILKRDTSAEPPIVSPTPEGLIVLRAPLRGLAWNAEAEAVLRQATCTPVRP
jgi:uncharacterized membrane protein